MLTSKPILRHHLAKIIENQQEQGHDIRGLEEELVDLPDSYDALAAFAHKLRDLPMRADWPYAEPDELDEIWAQCDPNRPRGVWREISPADAAPRIEAAFLGSVCGCILGKPLELHLDMATIQAGAEKSGQWPLTNYISIKMLEAMNKWQFSWPNTVRENIHFVEPDDDINYTILGMLQLEKHGVNFTKTDVRDLWVEHLPLNTVWGPERTMLVRAAQNHLGEYTLAYETAPDDWANEWNPESEFCGAQIRADAYGYACAGNPELAATLAWRDASFSHRKTGTYSTMWTAAAIAAAAVAKNPLEIFEIANGFVPQNSRFGLAMKIALEEVRASSDWLEGYERLHRHFGQYGHCLVYFESATLINSLFRAKDVADGFCMQVMQGNDTDSYGATAGSILGMYFGPGHLESRWVEPFNDDIHTALAWFFERSLSKLAKRMGELPAVLAAKA